jgi:hypothetical protein
MSAPGFDDIIFEKRNKEYGAYFLRKGYNRVLAISFIATCAFMFCARYHLLFKDARIEKIRL